MSTRPRAVPEPGASAARTGPLPIVVGSGLAGLVTALELAARGGCLLVTAGRLTGGAASAWAQGGIAAALAPDDSPAQHAHDTWLAGARAGDREVIARITDLAPGVVARLARDGVPFDRDASGAYDLALEGGHSRHRVAHAGDRSGAVITATLAALVEGHPDIEVLERLAVDELLLNHSGAVCGIRCGAMVLEGDRVVLASGGLGGLFPHTTNPVTATGAGVALAARAGARTDDLHLVQFHPTALDVGTRPAPLLTEALRGAGAVLRSDGERFVDELQPRDVVAAAAWAELQQGRAVHLDARRVDDAERRFPAVTALLAGNGLTLRDLLPVRPAAHYSMGGVTVDAQARSTVPGLWVVGEASRTGLHGANRLASNSLLEAVVTAQAAAASVTSQAAGWRTGLPASDPDQVRPRTDDLVLTAEQVRDELGRSCGVLREAGALRDTIRQLEPATGQDDAYVAWLLARSALAHPRSVGAHRRTDTTEAVPA